VLDSIIDAHVRGTRYHIRVDPADGLLYAGEPGVQLTWMDARVGDRVVTPRAGKPVEVQALWINVLRIASRWNARWEGVYLQALRSFRSRFWNKERDCLFDVIDVDHVAGDNDGSMRPNQVLAVGGLPLCLLDQRRARAVVDRVEARLLTPLGLRSLGADEPRYAAMYRGGPEQRDLVYHQGTVWPWLIGPFVEAWLRVRPDRPGLRNDARERFLKPLLRHLDEAGAGHVSEVADAEFPHRPGGCPFQAWSLGELIRLDRVVLAAPAAGTDRIQPVARRARRAGIVV
jgi:glycogen debranching enzyme